MVSNAPPFQNSTRVFRYIAAETFYSAMRAMQVGLLPAVRRFEEVMQLLQQRAQAKAAAAASGGGGGENGGGGEAGGGGGGNPLATDEQYNAYFDCATAALLAGSSSFHTTVKSLKSSVLTRSPSIKKVPPFVSLGQSLELTAKTCCVNRWL